MQRGNGLETWDFVPRKEDRWPVLAIHYDACLWTEEKEFLERKESTIEGRQKAFEVAACNLDGGTVGLKNVSDILQAHPDIVAIFSINDQAGAR